MVLDKDFRLLIANQDEFKKLVKAKKCMIIKRFSRTNVFVTNAVVDSGIVFGKLNFESSSISDSFRDSEVVLFKNDRILRNPAWFEHFEDEAKKREVFANTLIEPGDVLVFSPRL